MEDISNKQLGVIPGDGDRIDRGPWNIMVFPGGLPDPVLYPSKVATTYDKHIVDVSMLTWRDIHSKDEGDQGPEQMRARKTREADWLRSCDLLAREIERCRQRGIRIVVAYRMNAEDYYHHSWRLSDFGRAHPEWRIPKTDAERAADPAGEPYTAALDPAVPEVYEHRLRIFREVAENYDIDGIELNWRRWFHMISDPLENHPILTNMVREIRQMLDEVAKRKGRPRLLLGARVGPMLRGRFLKEDFPGTLYGEPTDSSCEYLGLDVETWIKEELVDYVCPCLFGPDMLPGLVKTAEFAGLAKNKNVGVYPTLSPWTAWGRVREPLQDKSLDQLRDMMRRHRDEICNAALQYFADGADGISKFNWSTDDGQRLDRYEGSLGYMKTLLFVHQFLGSAETLEECLKQRPIVETHARDWEL